MSSNLNSRVIADLDLDPERLRAGLNDGNRLRVTIIGDEERFAIWNSCVTKRHRFSGGCRFVQQRRVRDVERREVDDHLLEIQQRFEPTLRDFRLVRRVSGVPPGVFENVSLNDGRRDAVVVAGADK